MFIDPVLTAFSSDTTNSTASTISLIYIIFFAVYLILIITSFAFWVWMLVNAAKRTNWKHENDKVVWILIVALVGILGASIYYFVIKRNLDKKHR